MFRTIIAECNARERGRGAVSLAHAIVSATGPRLLQVSVHRHPPLPFPGSHASQREELEHELRAVRGELAPQALIRREGDLSPARALCRVTAAQNADLLVVGSRHPRWRQRIVDSDQALVGRNGDRPGPPVQHLRVLRHAPCPVLVAPRRSDTEQVDAPLAASAVSAL